MAENVVTGDLQRIESHGARVGDYSGERHAFPFVDPFVAVFVLPRARLGCFSCLRQSTTRSSQLDKMTRNGETRIIQRYKTS